MTEEEILVLRFLQESPDAFFTRREIARRAVKRKVFEENPRWADAAIGALVGRGMIEEDASGRCRFKPGFVV